MEDCTHTIETESGLRFTGRGSSRHAAEVQAKLEQSLHNLRVASLNVPKTRIEYENR